MHDNLKEYLEEAYCDNESNDDEGTTCDCCGDWFHDEVGDGWCGCGNV